MSTLLVWVDSRTLCRKVYIHSVISIMLTVAQPTVRWLYTIEVENIACLGPESEVIHFIAQRFLNVFDDDIIVLV